MEKGNAMFGHLDAGPLFYGVIIALGIYSMLYKLKKGDWLALLELV
ncbi:hypothetical protein GM524_12990, partial [Streptococcus pneumoniae]|nr:hypothetical protein [Streptococcus pneumoniae]